MMCARACTCKNPCHRLKPLVAVYICGIRIWLYALVAGILKHDEGGTGARGRNATGGASTVERKTVVEPQHQRAPMVSLTPRRWLLQHKILQVLTRQCELNSHYSGSYRLQGFCT